MCVCFVDQFNKNVKRIEMPIMLQFYKVYESDILYLARALTLECVSCVAENPPTTHF